MKTLLSVSIALAVAAPCLAQGAPTRAQPGFNLFTVQQDIEIGRTASAQAEAQLRMLGDAQVDAYLNRLISKLAAVAPGARYPYRIKAVNANEINAFALPGGPMYVNRGLINLAANEAELVGVLAHELSHVALRHGTHQASTAQLAQTGIGLLGGLISGGNSRTASIVNTVAGAGLNVAFLKFSRNAEYQADATGAEIMARAGYNPAAMADFFAKMRATQGRDPSKVEAFFSSHPASADREARIRTLAASLQPARATPVNGLASVQQSLGRLPAPGSAQQVAAAAPNAAPPATTTSSANNVRITPPSATMTAFRQPNGFYNISHPGNWRAYRANAGFGVSIVPPGGVVQTSGGQQAIVEGVIVNHYSPFQQGGGGTLKDATDDLVEQIVRANRYLRPLGAARPTNASGVQGFVIRLAGTSPVTGAAEQLTLVTQAMSDGHVIFVIGVAPASEAATFDPAFERMIQSLRVNDQAAHRN
jgi:Zn-dependent protease with chaperone function